MLRHAKARPEGNGAGLKAAGQATARVRQSPPRCASLTLRGEACRAFPARDGWPYCSLHRYLHLGKVAG